MNKLLLSIVLFTASCDTGNLKVIADLPKTLHEVSGTETVANSNLIWMLNDSGNSPKIYGLDVKGAIKKELKIKAKNHDWEDLTSDSNGNLYIGDFGNNLSDRKNLAILKVNALDLKSDSKVTIERISFRYPNQKKIPSKKGSRYFDCEAFFYFNDSLYLFTKSRVKTNFGKTDLYKIPAIQGQHEAQFISTFNTCDDMQCWITAADISQDEKKVVLLNHKSVWVFTNFENDNFFKGNATEYPFNHESQKEGVCFKNNSTLYITDEKSHGGGGNFYEFSLTKTETKD